MAVPNAVPGWCKEVGGRCNMNGCSSSTAHINIAAVEQSSIGMVVAV